MSYFLCKLIPPRPTFAQDMTAAEAKLMAEHVAYWSGLAEQGSAVAFGPVVDPLGGYGIGIIEAENEAEVHRLRENDPTIKSGLDFKFEIYPMPRLILRK